MRVDLGNHRWVRMPHEDRHGQSIHPGLEQPMAIRMTKLRKTSVSSSGDTRRRSSVFVEPPPAKWRRDFLSVRPFTCRSGWSVAILAWISSSVSRNASCFSISSPIRTWRATNAQLTDSVVQGRPLVLRKIVPSGHFKASRRTIFFCLVCQINDAGNPLHLFFLYRETRSDVPQGRSAGVSIARHSAARAPVSQANVTKSRSGSLGMTRQELCVFFRRDDRLADAALRLSEMGYGRSFDESLLLRPIHAPDDRLGIISLRSRSDVGETIDPLLHVERLEVADQQVGISASEDLQPRLIPSIGIWGRCAA